MNTLTSPPTNAAPARPAWADINGTAVITRPEWGDAKTVKACFGLCRSTLYRLSDEGKIRSSSLRERGKLRGKKLFSLDSIAAFIESKATGGEVAQ